MGGSSGYNFERLNKGIGRWRLRGWWRPENGCWIWSGTVNPLGYAHAALCGVSGAHRVMWLWKHGRLPAGVLRNECGNRLCINPLHWRDEVKAPSRVVARRELMRDLHGSGLGIGEIADRVGCCRQTVARFVRGLPVDLGDVDVERD